MSLRLESTWMPSQSVEVKRTYCFAPSSSTYQKCLKLLSDKSVLEGLDRAWLIDSPQILTYFDVISF